VALAALVVLNAVLLILVLRPSTPPPLDEPVPTFSPVPVTPGAVAGATSIPTPEAATAPPVTPAPAARLLTAANDRVAWRATTGTCEEPALLERTDDAGVTWRPLAPGVAPAVRLKASSDTQLFVIGGDPAAGCAPTFAFSRTSGDSWVADDGELAGSWYLAPQDRATIHGPRAEVPLPCATAVHLAGLDLSRAGLLCTDGGVWLTADGGASWAQAGTVSDAVAIAPTADGFLLAVLRPATCAGVGVFPVASDGAGTAEAGLPDASPLGCAPIEGAAPGQVAVAAAAANLWIWSGDAVLRSSDGGLTW